jgi:hypothetical protein
MGRGWIALALGIALAAGACSGDAEPPPLTDPVTTPSSVAAAVESTTTTDAPTTTVATTIATTTLPTAPAEERVGSVAKFEEQIDAVYAELGRFAAPREEVPFPDVTNVDPVVAFQGLIEFRYWMLSNDPWRDWVSLFTHEQTEYAVENRIRADQYQSVEAKYLFDNEPFVFHAGQVIDLAMVDLPDSARVVLTGDEVAVELSTSSGDFRAALRATGEVIEVLMGGAI